MRARFHSSGSVYRGTKQGRPLGFEIGIAIESDEPAEAIEKLLKVAHQMCFTEASLRAEVPLEVRHTLNGAEL